MPIAQGTSPIIWDTSSGSMSCMIPCPVDAPSERFPFWKATASRDGTRIAIPIQSSPEECQLCTWTLGEPEPTRSEPVLTIADLQPIADQDFSFLCQTDEGWTAVARNVPWEFQAEFAWNLRVSAGGNAACETQDDRRYTPMVNGNVWSESYENTYGLTLAATGPGSAAVVQTTPIAEGDLTTFLSGCFTLGTEKGPWSGRYMGAFTPVISSDGTVAAVDARITQQDYTIAVNDQCWPTTWPSVWAPVIHPQGTSVWAPVKESRGWTLACDGEVAWPGRYTQLWEPVFAPNGRRIAAVASPEFGQWTLALDGDLMKTRVDGYLRKPIFSPCGSRVGCTGMHKGKAVLLIDDHPMGDLFDKVWDPVFSQYGSHAAAKIKRGPWYTVFLDGMAIERRFIWMRNPAFTPDGMHLIICGIEKSGAHYHYTREFIALK
ncbi:hypothetical protein [Desulfoluna sp.]|uniref:hypothetical protein n=1 Tax=Desulfoluna sp. TaxID=2045199 RepID=UPI002611FB1C|nr:hypothetical protein [Desulfoluna sp.]